jgi:hypothetical protein
VHKEHKEMHQQEIKVEEEHKEIKEAKDQPQQEIKVE